MNQVHEIANKYKEETMNFLMGADLDPRLYEELYEHYLSSGEFPSDVAKARTGDPDRWIAEKYENEVINLFKPKLSEQSVAIVKKPRM